MIADQQRTDKSNLVQTPYSVWPTLLLAGDRSGARGARGFSREGIENWPFSPAQGDGMARRKPHGLVTFSLTYGRWDRYYAPINLAR